MFSMQRPSGEISANVVISDTILDLMQIIKWIVRNKTLNSVPGHSLTYLACNMVRTSSRGTIFAMCVPPVDSLREWMSCFEF